MRRLFAALAVAVAAAAGSAALAENATSESRARLAELWGKQATPAAEAAAPKAKTDRPAIRTMHRERAGGTGHWADNYRAGRVHPPAGH